MAAHAAVWNLANTTLQYVDGGIGKTAGHGPGNKPVQIFDAGTTTDLSCSMSGKSASTCDLKCTFPDANEIYTFVCPTGNEESHDYTNNEWIVADYQQFGCYAPSLQVVPVPANLDG